MEEATVAQTVQRMKEIETQVTELRQGVILRALLQAVSTYDYRALIQVVSEGMAFLHQCQVGEVVDTQWLSKREAWVKKARHYVIDE